MIDAYKIGVQIALGGNVGVQVEKLSGYFRDLDRIINSTKASVEGLGAAMRALTSEGRAAAASWREAATAMQQAARTASGARGAGVAAGGVSAAPPAAPAIAAPPIAIPYSAGRALVPYVAPGLPVPYWNGNTGFSLSGAPYTPYGESPAWRRSLSGGRSLIPVPGPGTGFTMPPGAPPTGVGPWGGWSSSTGWTGGPGGPPPGGPVGPYTGGGPYPTPGPIPLNSPWGRYPAMPGLNGLAVLPSWMGGEFLKSVFEKTAAFDAIQAGLLAQGFSQTQVNAAAAAAFATQRGTLGTTALGNIDLVSKLMAVVQDPTEAINLMPEFARLGVVLNATGHGAEGTELMDAIRAGEFRGVLTSTNPTTGKKEINTAGLSKFLQEIVATNILSHGQVGPAQILQFLRGGGSFGALIDDQELFARTVALQMAMGSGRAGHALQAFEQQFTAGRMSVATAQLLIDMGIVRGGGQVKDNPYILKNGPFNVILKPGAMAPGMQEEAFGAPALFTMDYLFPRLQAYLHKNYGSVYDNADAKTKLDYEVMAASQIASRLPGGTEMSEIIRNILLIGRDTAAFDKAMGRDAYPIYVGNNPATHATALGASYDAFLTAAGQTAMGPAIHGLDSLTKDLNALADWGSKNAGITSVALEGLTGAVLGLGAAGVIAILGTLGGATGLLAGVGAGLVIFFSKLNDLQEWLHKVTGGWYPDPKAPMPWDVPNPSSHHGDIDPAAPNGIPKTGPLFGRQSVVPPASAGGGAGSGSPVPVVVTNGRDLVHGVASGIGNQLNRPQQGYSGSDPTIDPSSAWYGTTPP